MLVNRCYQSLNSIDVNQKTPLDYAFQNKHSPIIEFEKQMTVTLFSDLSKNPELVKLRPEDFEFIMPLGRGAFGQVVLVRKDE